MSVILGFAFSCLATWSAIFTSCISSPPPSPTRTVLVQKLVIPSF